MYVEMKVERLLILLRKSLVFMLKDGNLIRLLPAIWIEEVRWDLSIKYNKNKVLDRNKTLQKRVLNRA